MILSKDSIISEVSANRIEIKPFDPLQVNENSYTVRLGEKMLVYEGKYVDTALKNPTKEIKITEKGILLEKGKLYIGHIKEFIGSDYYVPIIHGIESIVQKGLFIHVTANLIDIGNHCNFSLQMFPTENIYVYPEIEIAQISFWKVSGRIKLYHGKYKNAIGPVASKSYKHSEGKKYDFNG